MTAELDAFDPAARRCGSCRWHDVDGFYEFHGKEAESMGDMGFCRRYPPRPDELPFPLPEGTFAAEYIRWGHFVETDETEWCGEWAAAVIPAGACRACRHDLALHTPCSVTFCGCSAVVEPVA